MSFGFFALIKGQYLIMVLTYFVFGDQPSYYNQATFSMLSALSKTSEEDSVVVLTDHPEKLKVLDARIIVISIEQKTIEQWKGDHDFFWRIKIEALLHVAARFRGENILYLDTDTVLYADLNLLKISLSEGVNIMHTNEGRLSQLTTKTERRMWKQVKSKNYGSIIINQHDCMWNAGVVGISSKNIAQLTLALRICDEMCADNVTRRLIEQLSLSLALNSTTPLCAAEHTIGHYWSNKEQWESMISSFVADCYQQCLPIEEQVQKVAKMNFNYLPIGLRIPNTQKRLNIIVAKLFPNSNHTFIKR